MRISVKQSLLSSYSSDFSALVMFTPLKAKAIVQLIVYPLI